MLTIREVYQIVDTVAALIDLEYNGLYQPNLISWQVWRLFENC